MRLITSITIVAFLGFGLGSMNFAQTTSDPTTEKKKKKKKTDKDATDPASKKKSGDPSGRAAGLPPVQPAPKQEPSAKVAAAQPVPPRKVKKQPRQHDFETTNKQAIVWANPTTKTYFMRECSPETDSWPKMKLKDVQKQHYEGRSCPAGGNEIPLAIKN